MKRIIDGITYNTETATRVAMGGPSDPSDLAWWEMYQTRHGAFFKVITDHDGEDMRIKPMDDNAAQAFLEKYANDVVETVFGPFPEAGAAERRLTIRIPANLATRMEAAAQAKNLSLNSYAMRCFEQCAAGDGHPAQGG
jgi:hypothetical protein